MTPLIWLLEDDAVKVIVLAANGPHFPQAMIWLIEQMSLVPQVGNWGGYDKPGAEGQQALEEEIYLGLCWRWRNLPKQTIAEVQGKVIAGGLMLVWVCDLIGDRGRDFSCPWWLSVSTV